MPAFLNQGSGFCTNVQNSATANITINPGDTVIVFLEFNINWSLSSLSDNGSGGGNAYTRRLSTPADAQNEHMEIWTSVATKAATSVTANTTPLTGAIMTLGVVTYSGVFGFGNIKADLTHPFGTNPTIQQNTSAKDSTMVAFFGFDNNGSAAYTINPQNGTIRTNVPGTPTLQGLATVDNLSLNLAPDPVTCSVTLAGNNATWASAIIELLAVPAALPAHSVDAFIAIPSPQVGMGTALVCFGPITSPSSFASAQVTGQAGITQFSRVEAWIRLASTYPDHSTDEHMVEALKITAGNIIPGVGFTIDVEAFPSSWGCWFIDWAWA